MCNMEQCQRIGFIPRCNERLCFEQTITTAITSLNKIHWVLFFTRRTAVNHHRVLIGRANIIARRVANIKNYYFHFLPIKINNLYPYSGKLRAKNTKEHTYYLDSIHRFGTFCTILPTKPRLTALDHPSVILVRQTVCIVNFLNYMPFWHKALHFSK